MKLWFKLVFLCALISTFGFVLQSRATPGCSCTLSWEASPSSGIAGYAVYYGVSGSTVTNRLDVGQALSATITGMTPATTYFFFVVDYDSYGDESPPSNVLLYTTPPISPLQFSQTNGQLNIQFQVSPGTTCTVEYTPTLNPPSWTVLKTVVADTNGYVSVFDTIDPTKPARFYRGVIPSQQTVSQLSVSPGLSTDLQWDASGSGTAGYTVYYGAVGSSVTNQLNVGPALSAAIGGLSATTPYFFYVVSYDSSGDQSPPSNVVLYTTPAMSPLQISQVAGGMVNIQFTAPPQTACSVEVTTSLNPPTWDILTTVLANSNGLVSIYDTVDPSQPSRFYRGMIQGQLAPQVTAITGLTTTLQWNSSSSPSTIGYAVYYGVVGSSVTNRLDVGWAISATVSGLTPSMPYFFYVAGYDVFGKESPPSNVILFTTPASILPQPISQSVSKPVMSQVTALPGSLRHDENTAVLNLPAWSLPPHAVAKNNGLVTAPDSIDRINNRFYRAPIQMRFRTA